MAVESLLRHWIGKASIPPTCGRHGLDNGLRMLSLSSSSDTWFVSDSLFTVVALIWLGAWPLIFTEIGNEDVLAWWACVGHAGLHRESNADTTVIGGLFNFLLLAAGAASWSGSIKTAGDTKDWGLFMVCFLGLFFEKWLLFYSIMIVSSPPSIFFFVFAGRRKSRPRGKSIISKRSTQNLDIITFPCSTLWLSFRETRTLCQTYCISYSTELRAIRVQPTVPEKNLESTSH